MAAQTLMQAATQALGRNRVYDYTIMELYAKASELMQAAKFDNIAGNAQTFNREGTLPANAFRSLNEGYDSTTGKDTPITETLMIAGGDLDVDNYIIKTMGPGQKSTQIAKKVKSISLSMTKAMIKGDVASDPKSFNGLQARIDGNQIIEAKDTPTSGGDVLALSRMDDLKDAVSDPTHWIMNKKMRSKLTQAARNTTVGGYITYSVNDFGKRITHFDDLPIIIVDEDSEGNQIMPFTEASPGGGDPVCTSIYCVSIMDDGWVMLQEAPLRTKDFGELESKPVERVRVEWFLAMAIKKQKAAARLRGIKAGAVVADN